MVLAASAETDALAAPSIPDAVGLPLPARP